jgi:AcrR family transcriptional regulator
VSRPRPQVVGRPHGKRGGRRPGNPDTRSDVLVAASKLFSTQGLAATSVRAIASAAGVDPAMVHHHFGTKHDLFLAAVRPAVDPVELLSRLVAGDPDRIGERIVLTLLQVWDPAGGGGPLALLRTAVNDPGFAPLLREFLLTQVVGPVLEHLGVPADERPIRGALTATQMVGIAVGRFVLALPAVSTDDTAILVAAAGATVQRYLTGPLPDG